MNPTIFSRNGVRGVRGLWLSLLLIGGSLAVVLLPHAAWSQGLTHEWSQGFGDGNIQYGYSVDVDGAGNYVATGYFQGTVNFGGSPLTSAGGNDIFVAKFDAAGNHVWSNRFGFGGHQDAYRVALDGAGNVFVTGTFADTLIFGADALVSAGANDIFVAKLGPAGAPLWAKSFGDANEQVGYGLDTDGAGNVLVTGYFNGTVDFGGGPLTGDYDVFVAKFDPAGNHIWSKRFGDDSDQFAQGLGVDGAGNVLVTGYFYGDLDFGGGPLTGDVDIFVAKLDPSGNHIWSQRFGDATDQYGYNVAADGSGNVLVSGYYWGDVDFGGGTLTSAGDYDVFVAKFDSTGTHIWSKRFGDASQQAGYGLAVDGVGNVLLAGYIFGTVDFGGGTLTAPGSNNDIFVAKFDPAGNHVWSQNFGDADPQFGYGIAVEPGGDAVVTGGFQGTVDFGGGPITSAGGYDVFVAKFGTTQLPNLEVVSFSGPQEAQQLEDVSGSINLTIRNSGSANVTTSFAVGLYHSTDAVITTNDLFVARTVLPNLAASLDVTPVTFSSAVLPIATPSGAFLGVIVDELGEVVEADETDNTASSPITVDPVATAGKVVVYFDAALTQRSADCPGSVLDTLYVVAENLGSFITAIEYKINYPSIMTFIEDQFLPSLALGTSETGIMLAFGTPRDATGQLLVQTVIVQWTCDDCIQFNDPIVVVPHPTSGLVDAVAHPSGDIIVSTGGTSRLCVDSDGDGVLNGIDQCPVENASLYDVDGDGCVDLTADNRRVEFWAHSDFPVSYVINQNGAPGIPVASAASEVQNGLNTWNPVDSIAEYSFGGMTPQLDAQAMDLVNLVTFNDPDFTFPPGVLAVGIATSFTTPTFFNGELFRPGQLFDFDMIFNKLVQFSTATAGSGPRILDVTVHEGGHGLGISHSVVQSSTMSYVLTPSAETLAADDQLTLRMHAMEYATPAAIAAMPQLGGTIRDGYTNNPIAGAVVFAIDDAGDSVGCAITRDDGSYLFVGLDEDEYYVAVHPLDGSSPINFIQPLNINPVVAAIPPVLFLPEWWNDGESAMDDPNERTQIQLVVGVPQLGVDILTNVDLTTPTVVSVSPTDNSMDVPIGSAILIKFSEAINTGTIQGNLKLQSMADSTFLGGSAAVLSDDSLIAFIPSGVTFATTYELTVEPGLTDKFNNSIAAPFVSHFTTEAQPLVFMTSLNPGQGPAGAIVTIEGGGFESETDNNVVTFDGVPAVVQTATALQLTVTVPPGATTGQVQVLNSIQAQVSNTLPFTILTPQAVVKGSAAGLVAVGAVPRALTLLPDASQAFVATTDGFAVVETDATQTTFLNSTEILVPGGLDGMDATAVGDRVYAVSSSNLKFYGIDTSPVAVTNEVSLSAGTPLSVLVDSGRRRAYVPTDLGQITIWDIDATHVSTYETQIGFIDADPNLRGPLAIAQGELLLALTGTGKLLVFDLGPDTLLSEVSVGFDPRGVTTNPQGDLAYVTDAGGSIDVVSLVSFTNLQTIQTGGSLRQPVVTPDGAFLFAVNRELNVFSVIDLRVGSPTFHQVVANPSLGVNPTAGEIGSDGLFAFATSEMDQTLNAVAIGLGSILDTVSPPAGPVGARLVLAGSDFMDDDVIQVSFDGVMVSPDVLEDDRIVVTVPSNATSGPLSVVGTNIVGPPGVSNVHFFAVLDTTPPGNVRLAGGTQPAGAPDLDAVLAVAQTGDFAVVGGNAGVIHFLDTDPQSPTLNQFFDQVSVAPFTTIYDIAITPDGKRTFVLEQGAAQIAVVNSDRYSSGFKSLLAPVVLSASPTANVTRMAMHPDGRRLLVSDQGNAAVYIVEETSPGVYDVQLKLSLVGQFGTNGRVRDMVFHPAGRYAYLAVIDAAVANLVLVLDMTSETIVGSAAFPGSAPFQIPQSLAFTPDGNLCLAYTTQIAGPAARTLHVLNTVTPANPDPVGSYPISSSAPVAVEHVRVSPAGDRAVANVHQDGYLYFDIEDPTTPEALSLSGDVFHHLALVDFDWCRDPSITTDRTCFYSVSGFRDSVYVQDFSAPRGLAVWSGDEQTGVAGQTLPAEIRVRAIYAGSLVPAPGVAVTFSVTGGGGVFTGTGTATEVAVTGSDGVAGVSWTLGAAVGGGVHQAQAAAFGLTGSPASFSASAVADPNTQPLAVTNIIPPDNSANVSINTSTQVTFSRAVDTGSIGSGTMRVLQGSTIVPVTYGFSDLDRRVSMTPASPLATSTTYTLELTAGILDMASGALSTPLTTTFTTQAPPPLALNSVDPPSGLPGTPIIISGTGLDADFMDNAVTFSPSLTAVVTDAGTDFVAVHVPIGATSGQILVQVNAMVDSIGFTVLTPQEEVVDEVIGNVGTGSPTRSIVITPDGTRAYATGENVVVTIDVENLTSGDAIPVGQNPVAIVISPDGKFTYVANNGSGTVSVVDVDPNSTDFETNVEDINVGSFPIDLAIHPDGDRLFVVNSGSNDISIIDTDEFSETFHAVIGNVGTGSSSTPRTVTVTPDGTKLYIGTDENIQILSVVDFGVIGNIGTGNTGTKSLTVTPDGAKLVALTVDGQIVIYDVVPNSPTENQVIGSFGGSGNQQTKSLTVTPDGTQIWAVQEVGDVILVLSLDFTGGISLIQVPSTARTLQIVAEIEAGEDPAFVVFDPRGTGRVLVANPGDRTITVLGRRVMLAADVEIIPGTVKVWKIRSDDPTGLHLKSTMRMISARIELSQSGPIFFGESEVEQIVLKDVMTEGATGAPALSGETEVRDDDGDNIPEIYVQFDRLDFQLAVPAGESVPVLVTGKILGRTFMGLDTVETLRPGIRTPGGGQVVAAETPFEVSWQSPPGAGADEVSIYWTHGDGAEWYAVANRVPDTGSATWVTPPGHFADCRVLVVLSRGGEEIGSSMSQQVFTIGGPARVAFAGVEVIQTRRGATLQWTTSFESDIEGFHVLRSEIEESGYERISEAPVPARGEKTSYAFNDETVQLNRTYYYKLQDVSEGRDGQTFGPYAFSYTATFDLEQNAPNPFNPTTVIRFTLPKDSHVKLVIYDVAGRSVRTLIDDKRTADYYDITWDGRDASGSPVASGVYFYRIEAGQYRATRKMVMLK